MFGSHKIQGFSNPYFNWGTEFFVRRAIKNDSVSSTFIIATENGNVNGRYGGYHGTFGEKRQK